MTIKQSFLLLLILSACILSVAFTAYRSGYQEGIVVGRYQVARHIPEIRTQERINALAPRN